MKQYLDALKKILDEGTDRPDRTGVGSRAIFGVPLRFKMADGFPAMTTKKLAFEAQSQKVKGDIKRQGLGKISSIDLKKSLFEKRQIQ